MCVCSNILLNYITNLLIHSTPLSDHIHRRVLFIIVVYWYASARYTAGLRCFSRAVLQLSAIPLRNYLYQTITLFCLLQFYLNFSLFLYSIILHCVPLHASRRWNWIKNIGPSDYFEKGIKILNSIIWSVCRGSNRSKPFFSRI